MKKQQFYILMAFFFYLLNWFIAQLVSGYIGSLIFVALYSSLSGVFIPLFLMVKFKIKYKNEKKHLMIIGVIYLITFTALNVIGSDALSHTINSKPSVEVIIKYLILFIPMSFGLTVFCLYLIPGMILDMAKSKTFGYITAPIFSGIAMGFAFFVDTLGSIEMLLIMGVMGIFYSVGFILTRSLYLNWLFFCITMLFHTLGEAKYYHYKWSILIIQIISIVVFGIIFILIKNKLLYKTKTI